MRLILVRNAKCSQHIYPISQPVASAHARRVTVTFLPSHYLQDRLELAREWLDALRVSDGNAVHKCPMTSGIRVAVLVE